MRTMKRVFALLLAFLMVLSVGTVGVSAAAENDLLTTDFSLAMSEVDKTLTVALNCGKDISGFGSGSGDMSIKDSSGNDASQYFTLTAIAAGELLDMTKAINTSHWGASAEDYENGDSMKAGTWVTYTYTVSDVIPDDTYTFTMTLGDDFSDIMFEMYSCNEGEVTANYVVGNPAGNAYEIYYTLDKSGENDDAYKDHEVTDQVTAEIFLVSNEANVTVQAYDIYLTYDDGLVFNKLDGMDGKPYTADAADVTDVAEQGDKVAHIQLVADTTTYPLEKGVAKSLGKVVFDFAEDAAYGDDYKIALTDGEDQEDVTNIAIGGDTEGDETSYYPVAIDTIDGVTYSGAEIVTKYDVTFDTDGGSTVDAQEVGHNLFAEKPEDPSKANHTFAGWYTDDTFATEFVFNATKITEDTVIYAKWTKDTVTVTWKNGDEVLGTDEIYAGTAPNYTDTTPTKAADAEFTYTFVGWSATDGGEKLETLPAATEDVTYYAFFSKTTNKYEVKYMPETGDDTLHTESVEYGKNPTWTAGKPTKADSADGQYTYNFLGWTEIENPAFGAAVVDLNTFVVKKDTTFYPVFEQVTRNYTVLYEKGANGSFGADDATSEIVAWGTVPSDIPTVTPNAGYIFDGWFDTTNSVKVENIETYQVKGNVTLTAQYKGKEITVKFNGNGADTDSPTMADQTWTYGTEFEMLANEFVKTYWTFNGWNTDPEGNGNSYTAGNKYTDLTTADEITLYAQWTQADLTITYAKNLTGGSVGGNEVANYGDEITVIVTTQPGYNIGSVTYTPDGGTAQEITADENGNYIFTMPDNNVTVSATFTPINYTVEVGNVDNGSVTIKTDSGDMDKIEEANVGQEIVLNVEADDGYEIESVTVTKEGETAGTPATKNDDGTYSFDMPASNVTVTATFKGKSYTIVYKANGGDGTMGNGTGTFGTATALDANAFSKTGYEFKGWTTPVNGATVTVEDKGSFDPETYAESYTMTAVWEAKDVTVTLDYCYDKEEDSITVKYDGTYNTLTDPETRAGYEFLGWFDGEGENATEVKSTTKVEKAEAHTLYAKWDLIPYTITYELDNGKFVEGYTAPSSYDVTQSVILPNASNVIRNGYIFGGWYDKTDANKTVVAEIQVGTTGDKTYCAIWNLDSYTITFELGNGKWPSDSAMTGNTMTYNYDTPVTLPAAESNDPMYAFTGWSLTTPTESWKNTNYTAGVNYGQSHYGDITLTAVYGPAVKYELEEYKYAYDGWYLLRVKDTFGTDTTQTYKFGEEVMYYTTDENYRIDDGDAGAFYLLVSESNLNQDKLNNTTDKALELTAEAYAKIKPATADRAIIDYNGDINDDTILNIADANIVYQMVEQASAGNYYSMDQLKNDRRLEADMAKGATDEGNLHRASIADVHAIVNLINKAN